MWSLPKYSLCVCILALFESSISHAASYTITNLGTLGGYASSASDISENGLVTGWAFDSNGNGHAFLYDSEMHDLGTLGGRHSYGGGVNNTGWVTGGSGTVDVAVNHAFLYDGSVMQDIGTLGGAESYAQKINESNQVTGYSYISGQTADYHAFFYDGERMYSLSLGGNRSVGYDINDSGWIAGWSDITGSNIQHAFLYDGDTVHDLGTLGGRTSSGYGINNNGWVTGGSRTLENNTHAFLYDGSVMHDLGTLSGDSVGYDINLSGHVVGNYYNNETGLYNAFFFNGTDMLDLCELVDCVAAGWRYLYGARAINDRGDIVGSGVINGSEHAFLISPVPLPMTLWLFVSGLLGLGAISARTREK